jgi:hypothetical protein
MKRIIRLATPANLVFALLFTVFVLTALRFAVTLPFWDGYAWFRYCYMYFAETDNPWCWKHSSIYNTVFYGVTQKYFYGEPGPVYAENILLALALAVSFRKLLGLLFGGRLGGVESTLITFIILFNPVFILHTVFPAIDYPLTAYLVILLLALHQRRFISATVLGAMMAFTKEPGIMMYTLCVGLYLLFAPVRLGRMPGRQRLAVYGTAAPLLLFAYYATAYGPPVSDGWSTILHSLVRPQTEYGFFYSQVAALAVINFNWILSAAILLGILARARRILPLWKPRRGREGGNARRGGGAPKTPDAGILDGARGKAYFYVLTVLIVYFNTSTGEYHNPRYMLPVFPLFVILFSESLMLVSSGKARTAILACIILLLYASESATLDPVSRSLYGTFPFGNHSLLCMDRFYNNCVTLYGRDELLYNFEALRIGALTDEAIPAIGYDKTYVMNDYSTFLNFADLCMFDNGTGRRTALDRIATKVACKAQDYPLWDKRLGEFYFIDYPNANNSRLKAEYSSVFTALETHRFAQDGYYLDVIHYRKADAAGQGP